MDITGLLMILYSVIYTNCIPRDGKVQRNFKAKSQFPVIPCGADRIDISI